MSKVDDIDEGFVSEEHGEVLEVNHPAKGENGDKIQIVFADGHEATYFGFQNIEPAEAWNRSQVAEGLRELADLIDEIPDFPVKEPVVVTGDWLYTDADVKTAARAMKPVEKEYAGSLLYLKRKFSGGVTLKCMGSRETTCEVKKVKKSRTVRKQDPEAVKRALANIPEVDVVEEYEDIEYDCKPIFGKPDERETISE